MYNMDQYLKNKNAQVIETSFLLSQALMKQTQNFLVDIRCYSEFRFKLLTLKVTLIDLFILIFSSS